MAHQETSRHCGFLQTGGRDPYANWPPQTPLDVLSSLPSLPSSLPASESIPLLLLTPSFAPWLDPSSDFLQQWVGRLYGPSSPSPLYAVAAVVDKLPDPQPASVETAVEGLSLLVVGKDGVHGKAASPRQIRGSGVEEPDILISVQSKAQKSSSSLPYEIGLRLANTVFVNGRETTLFGMRWAWDSAVNKYTLDASLDLRSCLVAAVSPVAEPQLQLPLHPVTERRKVLASMGNILRQVATSTDAASTKPMPASTELEKTLPRYLEEHNIVDRRVTVWALVEQPDNLSHRGSPHDRIIRSLCQGGKLHRVMSGGGGWGKKQGLLSLDPEVSFSTAASRDKLAALDELFDSGAAAPDLPAFMGGDDLSLLSQVATAGDFIQFFVSVEPTNSPDDLSGRPVTYSFGIVSDIEEPELPDVEGEPGLVAIPGFFGALSEKAIAYSQPVPQGETMAPSNTKLDVPGCRVDLHSVF
ncbi:hypothetical protein N7510_011226 [Penicillium lagena]|uniref:uncharacterized protein n=1 Tax=Penicillium lagena TaxID=94218 RepID=UPI0025405AD5|nr:uncharacterized protein N7510_011226 [Penicillium lagena]KAJ5601692.1 hypothetical protein N7510_011226 [Penicillium lagena]